VSFKARVSRKARKDSKLRIQATAGDIDARSGTAALRVPVR